LSSSQLEALITEEMVREKILKLTAAVQSEIYLVEIVQMLQCIVQVCGCARSYHGCSDPTLRSQNPNFNSTIVTAVLKNLMEEVSIPPSRVTGNLWGIGNS
jgi:hypothetical protein